jgi:hypothetical protein
VTREPSVLGSRVRVVLPDQRHPGRSGCGQEAVLQVGKPSSAIRLPFDEFEAIDVSFHGTRTIRERQSRQNRRFVPLDTASKGEKFSDARRTHVFQPAIKSLTALVANEMQEAVGQLSSLREDIIHLTKMIQLLLCPRTQRLGTGQHPPADLPWGHIFEGRARNRPRQSGQSRCSLWPSTPPKAQCRCVRPLPSAPVDTASTSRARCVAVCGVLHRDHVAMPASAEWFVAQPPAAWQ